MATESSPAGSPKSTPETPSPTGETPNEKRGGRFKAIAERLSAKIKSLRSQKAADKVLRDIVKERPENKGADISKKRPEQVVTVDRSQDWQDAIRGFRKNKLRSGIKKWAEKNHDKVDKHLKQIDGWDNPDNTRGQNFENLAKAVTAAKGEVDQQIAADRREQGQILIDGVSD